MYGFPLFVCTCHWLQIDRTSEGHVLVLNYMTDEIKLELQVTNERFRFVSENISTGKLSDEFGGSTEIEISSIGSMGSIPPGKKGITGPGQMGHSFPRIDPLEVELFNRLELQRIKGDSSDTIEIFNRRMNRMWIHWEAV